jgi:hypothetical protein
VGYRRTLNLMLSFRLIFIFLLTKIFCISFLKADFSFNNLYYNLSGKWSGTIQSEIKVFGSKGELIGRGKCSLKIISVVVEKYEARNISAQEQQLSKTSGFAPIGTSFSGLSNFTANSEFFDSKGNLYQRWTLKNKEEIVRIYGNFLTDNTFLILSDDEILIKQEQWLPEPFGYQVTEDNSFPAFSILGMPLFPTKGVKFSLKDEVITIDDIWQEDKVEMKVFGKLYRTEFLKKFFYKDVEINKPIQTNNETKITISLPQNNKVYVAENTNVVFKSENVLELTKGIIYNIISKFKPKSKFEVHTPTAIIGVRGTEYLISVSDDGTTTIIVVKGEVEIFDKHTKKIEIVKKNYKTIINSSGFLSKPIPENTKDVIPQLFE